MAAVGVRNGFTVELTDQLEFGGERGSFNPFDPTASKTIDVAGNELTWLLRHAEVNAVAHVDTNGVITIQYSVTDTLDLRPSESRSEGYNAVTTVMGTVWHDMLGAEEAAISAEWTEVIEPN